jgi:hypothetical protein
MRIRKQVYELTPSDIAEHPAWEFALDEEGEDGQDEATVRPHPAKPPIDPGDGMSIVRASFILADGTKLSGYLTPPIQDWRDRIGTIQPTIVTNVGQVPFWFGLYAPPDEELVRLLQMLGKRKNEVFPVSFCSEVEIVGGEISGTISGFLFGDPESARLRA